MQAELGEASASIDRQVQTERNALGQRVESLADDIVRRLLGTAA